MKLLLVFSLFLVCNRTVFGRIKLGDACKLEATGKPGTCKPYLECNYAQTQVNEEKKRPQHCFYADDGADIVCCPLEDGGHVSGALRHAFRDTFDGVLRSDWVTCKYDGSLPTICCDERVAPQPAEPAQCPATKLGKGDASKIAWKKCQEYQRYVQVCKKEGARYKRGEECAMTTLGSRITGGIPAREREIPHMVLLGCASPNDESEIKWISGGSLISDRHVLTAAHAMRSAKYGNVIYALMGILNKTDAGNGSLHYVINHEPYKLYDPAKNKHLHDIAILTIAPRVIFNAFVRPACLPYPQMQVDVEKMIAGWGSVGKDISRGSDILLKALIEVQSNSKCSSYDNWQPRSMLCAGAELQQGRDSCKGDSGGPLMSYSNDFYCSYMLEGIVSHGPLTCGQGAPAVYTKVSHDDYMSWIVEKIFVAPYTLCSYLVEGIVSHGPLTCGQGAPAVNTKVSHDDYMSWIVEKVWLSGSLD